MEMKDLRLSASDIKILACLSMLIDHTAAVFQLSGTANTIMRLVLGRPAFPLFCFALVEGFRHTRNVRRYALRLLLAAIISEIPYTLVFFQKPLGGAIHNTLFTLFLGLLMLQLLQRIRIFFDSKSAAVPESAAAAPKNAAPLQESAAAAPAGPMLGILPQKTAPLLVSAAVVAVFSLTAELLRVDYGYSGILCIAALYVLRSSCAAPFHASLWGCMALNIPNVSLPFAFLAAIPLYFYTGERGEQKLKYFFYVFYPGHLLVLYLLAAYLQ